MKRSRKRCTVRSPAGVESKANLPPMKMIPVLLLIAALGAAAFAQDEKPAPAEVAAIPQAPKARLSLEVEADNIKWAQRALVAPFKARLKGEAWNAEASAFVGHALEYWADLNIASRRVGGLSAEGKKVTAAGCKDPLVLYFSGAIQFADTGEWHAGLSEMEEALKLVEADKSCPRALAHFIARNLGMRAEKSGKQAKDISVAQVRELIATLQLSAHGLGWRIAIIAWCFLRRPCSARRSPRFSHLRRCTSEMSACIGSQRRFRSGKSRKSSRCTDSRVSSCGCD